MTKKLNGYGKLILVGLAILAIVFNTGVTYNHIYHLSEQVEKLTEAVEKLDGKIDEIKLTLAKGENQ